MKLFTHFSPLLRRKKNATHEGDEGNEQRILLEVEKTEREREGKDREGDRRCRRRRGREEKSVESDGEGGWVGNEG